MEDKITVTLDITENQLSKILGNQTKAKQKVDPLLSYIKNGFFTNFVSAAEAIIFIYLYSARDNNNIVTTNNIKIMKNIGFGDSVPTIRKALRSLQEKKLITQLEDTGGARDNYRKYEINTSAVKISSKAEGNKKAFEAKIYQFVRKNVNRAGFGNPISKTAKILEMTPTQFSKYIEDNFTEGMSWENKKEWSIDHVIPISSATSLQEAEKLNHYTNLRPMWLSENSKKSNKLF